MAKVTLDAITAEIIWTRLVSIVDEASATFIRTSFSTLVREANDFAVVLTDREGRSVAQSSLSIPSFICTLPATVRHFITKFGYENIHPGDVFITNDPWLGTGHLNDINMAMPIFQGCEIVAFAAVVSHVSDIGGRLRNAGNRELFEEGLRLPPLKLLRAGTPDENVLMILEGNVRTPEETVGDVWAQITTCRTLSNRLITLLDEYGLTVAEISQQIRSRSEDVMRRAIIEVPDGQYRHVVENDSGEDTIVIDCKVKVSGSDIVVDYTGSSPQMPKAINVVPAYTFAYSAYAFKAILAPNVPNNEGSFVPLKTFAPAGTILSPEYPAPCSARGMVGHLLPPAIMGALAQAIPEKVQASPGSPSNTFMLTGRHRGRRYSTNAFLGAGQGGSLVQDGNSAVSFPSNLANTPIEVLEALSPVRVIRRAISRGSGGNGRSKGGDGLIFEFEIVADEPVIGSFIVNRLRSPAQGLCGGAPGRVAQLRINGHPADPTRQHVLTFGDTVLYETGGGGGFGSSG